MLSCSVFDAYTILRSAPAGSEEWNNAMNASIVVRLPPNTHPLPLTYIRSSMGALFTNTCSDSLRHKQWNNVAGYSLCFGNGLSKISMFLFYMDVSPISWHKWLSCVLIGVVSTYSLVVSILVALSLAGVRPDIGYGKTLTSAYAWLNFSVDVAILLMPLALIAPLRLGWRGKVSLSLLFATGLR